MYRKIVLAVCLLLMYRPWAIVAQETLTIGTVPTAAELSTYEKVDKVKKAKASPKAMAKGGYKLAEIDTENKLKWYVMGEDVLLKVFIPKGAEYTGWLVKDGETSFSLTTIPASTKNRYLLIAAKEGKATLILITNGATLQDEPVVLDAFQFEIGPQPDDDPVTPKDELAKLALADIKAGNGTIAQAIKYRDFLTTVTNGNMEVFKTYGDFYTSLHDGAMKMVGSADVVLPSMRAKVSEILKAQLGGKMGDPFPPATQAKVVDTLKGIVKRLESLQ